MLVCTFRKRIDPGVEDEATITTRKRKISKGN